jgi:hypothetical protein
MPTPRTTTISPLQQIKGGKDVLAVFHVVIFTFDQWRGIVHGEKQLKFF